MTFSRFCRKPIYTGKVRKRMDRNGPKRTQYKGENVIKQIMSEIFIQSIYFFSAFTIEIYFVQYIEDLTLVVISYEIY